MLKIDKQMVYYTYTGARVKFRRCGTAHQSAKPAAIHNRTIVGCYGNAMIMIHVCKRTVFHFHFLRNRKMTKCGSTNVIAPFEIYSVNLCI